MSDILCSHCGKSAREVTHLLGSSREGRRGHICDECVVMYFEMLNEVLDGKKRHEAERRSVLRAFAMILHTFLDQRQVGLLVDFGAHEIPGMDTLIKNGLAPDLAVFRSDHIMESQLASYLVSDLKMDTDILPDLVVEVRSPDRFENTMVESAHRYLALGVGLVWIVLASEKRVRVWQTGSIEEGITLTVADTLEGRSALPGFVHSVFDIFLVAQQLLFAGSAR